MLSVMSGGSGTGFDFTAWPPPGAEAVGIDGGYGLLARAGYGYGPAFQGVRAVWRRGEEVFAEVVLPEEQRQDAGRFGIHPALLDAALQAGTLGAADTGVEEPGEPVMPFAWNGVVLHAGGASVLRVRLVPGGPSTVSLEAGDEAGGLVVTMDSLVFRVVSAEQPATAVGDSLFRVDWTELSPVAGESAPSWVPVTTADEVVAPADGGPAVAVLTAVGGDDTALALASRVLGVVQTWLAEAGSGESRLVVATRGAVPAGGDSTVTDPSAAAVWGLVRAAQAENPGRIILLDLDPAADGGAEAVLGSVLAGGEPQIAVRGSALSVPRLVRIADDISDSPVAFSAEGTVVVSGAGALGGLVAKHLVARHGVRRLMLASRRGWDADGMADLVAELTEQGAEVSVVACDVSDRAQVAELLATVPEGHRLTGVVHTAGVFDDGVIEALTPDRLAGVFAPKVDAVRHLDELTRGLDLDAFVVFSSIAGVFGGAGQGNYAAANAFLDGLMAGRRAAGLPGLSLAWGLWEETLGMATHLSSVDQARASRGGVLPISAVEGMELFDAAVGSGQALLVPVKLDLRGLRAGAAAGGEVPHLLRGLVRSGRQLVHAAGTGDERRRLADRLVGLAAAEQEALLLDLVRAQAAVVLGHAGPEAVRADAAFRDAGFDSLTSVELRNRLREGTGLKLSATLVFDYPNPLALARHLRDEFGDVVQVPVVPTVVVAGVGEPIAIVGMACRLPGGVAGPEDLWRLVAEGRDAVSGFPEDRGWDVEGLFDPDPDRPGTSYTSRGGFLHEAGLFDAGFFGISPREALAMDPQQRLLLETSWEALERADIDPISLKGTDVGVFSGLSGQGYGAGVAGPEVEGFAGTGMASSVASGRVSYAFGFEGPAVSVDTACSSSLVAIHLAAQALRQGECSMALAGGVMVMGTPGTFVAFSRQRGLAGDGHCKAFASGADGTVLSEGVGVVALERLSVARERGHQVLAVIRGSAVNQDGASNGLTAPNGPSQQRVIRKALTNAGLSPSDVDVVEAHGTGTALGDPIEAQALLATYGQGRDPERPLWLGSLKSNIGHAQAAAGVGGVIKMVQALRHDVMPATLHVQEPTTEVDWSAGAVELLTEAREWPRNGHPRRAGVSSFGISGTNAHLILEEAPDEEALPALEEAGVVPLVVSARSAGSLAAQAGRLVEFVEGADEVSLARVAGALVSGRAVLGERAVVVAGSGEEALAGLRALACGESAPGVVVGSAGSGVPGKVVWVFPGQGSQWVGMGRELLDSSPVFAERIRECATALERWVGWSLVDVLRGEADSGLVDRVDVVQPASFAVMVGLAAMWESVGVRPDAVLGHSQGEIAAACVAGALSLEDAVRVVVLRSRAIAAELSGHGGMASVALGGDEVVGRLVRWAERVEVAAVNGPSSVVIAGDAETLDEALEVLSGEGIRVRRVAVDYASHTRHVEDIRDTLAKTLAGIVAQAPTVPFYSTVTGCWVRDAGILDGGYWYRNLRQQVGFGPAVVDLLGQGHTVFVEVSAHPVLVQPISEIVDGTDVDAVVVGSLRRDDGGLRRLLVSVAELFVRGVAVDLSGALPQVSGRVDLPTYAFDHRHYWLQSAGSVTDAESLGQAGADHPLLGAVVQLPQSDGLVFTSRLSLRSHPWLADHAVGGVVLFPGTGLVELAVRAGDEAGCSVLDELVIEAPLVLPGHGGVRVQVALSGPDDNGSRTVDVYSLREDGTDVWTRHATGVLSSAPSSSGSGSGTGFDFTAWPPLGAQPVEVGDFYDDLVERGYVYGPAFQGLRAVWRRGEEVFAEVALPEDLGKEAGRFGVHPALLDAALQAATAGAAAARLADADVEGEPDGQELWLPFAWNGLELHAAGASVLRVRVAQFERDSLSLEAGDEAGGLVVTMDSLVSRAVPAGHLEMAADMAVASSLFGVEWTELTSVQGAEPAPSWVVVATAEHVATLADDVLSGAQPPAVAFMEALSSGDDEDVALALTSRVLEVVQCWLAGAGLEESRLAVVTRGAVPAGGDSTVTDPSAAAVWGLVRAAQAENPGRIILLDLDPAADGGAEAVLGPVLASGEPQIAVRGTALSAPRLTPAAEGVLRMPADTSEWRLVATGGGTPDSLALLPDPGAAAPLAAGQVRVGLRALGINFRDVLLTLGMFEEEAEVGGEGAGVVLEVGEGVTGLAVGDRVMGLTGDRFGSVTVTDHRYLVRMPAGWSFQQAASVPVVFLTAYYGLCDLAGLRAGESVLVHAAAGGVGMAATQIARHLGARVLGTASESKWAVLRELGFADERIASSRTAEFEERFLTATSGAGVDVVLNSLAGELVDASLRLLPRGGRFMEMGKTDIRDADAVARAHSGVDYQAFDLTEAGPDRIQQMLTELVALFDAGVLTALPRTTWDVRCAPEAFRYMSQARHVGKVVLSVPKPFDAEGTVLVSGAGSLGGLVAKHLVARHGVRHLVLASRRGAAAEGVEDVVAELTDQGAEVSVVACDVSDRAQVAALLASVPEQHPLTGVVHTAGALDDGVIGALTPDRLAGVFAPKVDAVRHLDELTRGMDLDAFVVFSSVAGVFGGAGQGNYAAANAFLDGLMASRRAAGLPGVSLAWGLWEQITGLTAHLGEVDQARMSRGGVLAISAVEGMELFDAAVGSGQALLVPIKLDLQGLRAGASARGEVPHVLRGLVRSGRQLAHAGGTGHERRLADRLAGLSAAEQATVLLDLVRAQVAAVLGYSPTHHIDTDQGLFEIGFDSLTAIELRNRLRNITEKKLSPKLVFAFPTPGMLAAHLRELMCGEQAANPPAISV
ncbi:SDR family NAD(P)-dependent oxidoreductase [Streptomyces sp. NPDC102274]|uniref:SDR family NAD(P)-dependent oxidoreductase n=1 Tax=Streptomyces sp. NPDC102274 TaxID=3366151 RepID=UPI00380D00B9